VSRPQRSPRATLGLLARAALILSLAVALALAGSAHGAVAAAADEPLAPLEWWRSVVGADRAEPPGPGKPITIVDSGLDITHEEFASRANTFLLNLQTISEEGDDHGTEVGSVIAAPVNGVGLVGVYPQAILRSWDASPFGELTTAAAVAGIVEAAKRGPGVINLSFGGEDDRLVQRAILYAVKHGSLVIASSGNEGIVGNPPSYPAVYPHVLTVAATNERGEVAPFSTQSNAVDVAAPGVHIPVAEPRTVDPSGYVNASGTSYSAPLVSGAAAWVWTSRPELDNTQLAEVLRLSARDMAPVGFDRASGYGLLDIPKALVQAAPPRDPLEPNDDVDQVVPKGIVPGGERPLTRPGKGSAALSARVDRYEDPHDVYRVWVPARRTVTARTSGGNVDLRILRQGARSISAQPAGSSARAGAAPDSVSFRNRGNRGVYAFVDVRPDRSTVRASYLLRVTTSARR
jgi:subtilisin family serine protease